MGIARDNWMRELHLWWAYLNENDGGSIAAWWATMRIWWGERPRRVPCAFCQRLVWTNGDPDAPSFCNQYCFEAYEFYGGPAYDPDDDGEIQF